MHKAVTELNHPLVAHALAELRDASTPSALVRDLVEVLTCHLAVAATADLRTTPVTVNTPVAEAQAARLAQRVTLVPILRAGLGMVDPLLTMIRKAEVRHLGVYRDEQTLKPVEYYHKLPDDNPPDVAMILDPMLATGGSAVWALRALREWGVADIRLLSLIAAPEGVEHVTGTDAGARVFVCAIDEHLNEHGYIVPGLGDAGDRIFNT